MNNDPPPPPPKRSFSVYVANLGMDVAPKMYVRGRGGGGGALSSVYHAYVIRKYCMVSDTVRIKENYYYFSHN